MKITPFDAGKYIKTDAAREAVLQDAISTGHAGYIAAARRLDPIARALDEACRQLAREMGL